MAFRSYSPRAMVLSLAVAAAVFGMAVSQAQAEEKALVIARDMDVNALDPARTWCEGGAW